jgi:hypothetical protein
MMAGKVRTLTSAGLLLVSMQICPAAEQRQETFKLWWPLFGQKAQQEISALPKAGRAALQKVVVARSLFKTITSASSTMQNAKGHQSFL